MIDIPDLTDADVRDRLGRPTTFTLRSQPYVLGLLRMTGNDPAPDVDAERVVQEHVRRMLGLMEAGPLIVLLAGTAAGDPDWGGLGVFDSDADEVRAILDADPLVQAGMCTVEIHLAAGFPGTPGTG